MMRLLQIGILRIVAIQAKRGGGLGQDGTGSPWSARAGLMSDMARVAAHIERRMTAALFGHVHPGLVAVEAEVLFFPPKWVSEVVLVVDWMRIVARKAVAHCRRMHRPLDVGGILVLMAGEAEATGSW